MDKSVAMRVPQRLRTTNANVNGVADRQMIQTIQYHLQAQAGDVLHCEVLESFNLADLVSLNNIRMIQLPQRPGLAVKTLDQFFVLDNMFVQYL